MTQRTVLTPNEIVAFNLRAARRLRNLTQEQAAERLEPFLGERWSVATFSAAEQSITGKRVRQFDADLLVALARAFELPVDWFLLPPETATRVRAPWAKPRGSLTPGELIDLLFVTGQGELHDRLNGLLSQHPASVEPQPRPNALEDAFEMAGDLQTRLADALRELAQERSVRRLRKAHEERSERETRILELMGELNVDRPEAEMVAAIEAGESEGDTPIVGEERSERDEDKKERALRQAEKIARDREARAKRERSEP